MLTVAALMSRELVTIAPDASLAEARERLTAHHLRHLPVLDRGRLVGVISERDLAGCADAARARGAREPRVRERMRASVETVAPEESATVACRRMLERRVSCLPVVRAGHVDGMLTEHDFLRLFVRVARFSGHEPTLDPPVMTRASGEIVVASPEATACEALELCRSKGIRHLPVVRDGWLVGMLSDRDLLPLAGRADGELRTVGEVMTSDYVALVPDTRLSAAAECMLANGFHSLPVLAGETLRGIVTSADVLAAIATIPPTTLAAACRGEAALSVEAADD